MSKIYFLFILAFLFSTGMFSQKEKDSLLKSDIEQIISELKFMYDYDQALRKYLDYSTFNRSFIDSIENKPDSISNQIIKSDKVQSKELRDLIWNKYITPFDSIHAKRLIEITNKYGFPSIKRVKTYYKGTLDFNPVVLFIHSPFKFSLELKALMKEELHQKNLDRCTYGYLLWHFEGRKDFKPMLENGYEFVNQDGKMVLMRKNCD